MILKCASSLPGHTLHQGCGVTEPYSHQPQTQGCHCFCSLFQNITVDLSVMATRILFQFLRQEVGGGGILRSLGPMWPTQRDRGHKTQNHPTTPPGDPSCQAVRDITCNVAIDWMETVKPTAQLTALCTCPNPTQHCSLCLAASLVLRVLSGLRV